MRTAVTVALAVADGAMLASLLAFMRANNYTLLGNRPDPALRVAGAALLGRFWAK
jgi:hypothetical protein